MTNKQRLDEIEKFIREHKYADLHTLGTKFDISLSTVRRALNELETNGVIRRHHGGASLVDEESAASDYDFITQDDRQSEEKHRIAHSVASKIESGMTVIIDGGTTSYAVAKLLTEKRLVVITNSLPVAALFSEVGSCETIVTGGTVYARLGILYGPTCEQALSQVHADIAVCGCAGVTAKGLWNTNSFIVSFQQRMIESSDQTFYVVDSSKHDRRALHLSTPFKPNLTVATDAPPPDEITQAIQEHGGELIVAQ
ncbi:DeoR/GlpR family DNA-binding transcription regulator [Cerasicoccus maritimus]|uniref:DeoR/GlpR family DNA-binding transcription regulator n=1 Tax=Cerasicoccus maritimus TaxID=490089 RepID=UPI002852756A|nr:DeoR/GlpR family DNA-binding transcription regulator [Cerasicoccus maritimus]